MVVVTAFFLGSAFFLPRSCAMEIERIAEKSLEEVVALWTKNDFGLLEEDDKLVVFGYTYLQARFAQELYKVLSKSLDQDLPKASVQVSRGVTKVLLAYNRHIKIFKSILVQDNPKLKEIKHTIQQQQVNVPWMPISGKGLETSLLNIVKARKLFLKGMKPHVTQSEQVISMLERTQGTGCKAYKQRALKMIKNKNL